MRLYILLRLYIYILVPVVLWNNNWPSVYKSTPHLQSEVIFLSMDLFPNKCDQKHYV